MKKSTKIVIVLQLTSTIIGLIQLLYTIKGG